MNDAPPLSAVQTFGLTRLYGPMTALSNLDPTVNQGDLFGFIGSTGAGKTTTLRILATFLAPSAGRAVVLGHDVVKDADAVRQVIRLHAGFLRRLYRNLATLSFPLERVGPDARSHSRKTAARQIAFGFSLPAPRLRVQCLNP